MNSSSKITKNTYDISVIIVNYNVRYFLIDCIDSVLRSIGDMQVQVIVVDNASIDGSVDHIIDKYPSIEVIANQDNVGFAVANNQGFELARGKYILLLNPDTVIEENTLLVCFQYMESQSKVGALGVKMIDGSGNFLPESKRALPNPWNSFCKLAGLSTLFPKSAIFNSYSLGYLSEDECHKIEVLCGAFMFLSHIAIKKVGLLDENFFMYGEDIDLCLRVLKNGFEIHYLPTTTIIHFKGESTKKGSLDYVSKFYSAMGIYVDKHFGNGRFNAFKIILKIAITLRAVLSYLKRIVSNFIPLLVDVIIIYLGIVAFAKIWAVEYHLNPMYYDKLLLHASIMMYVLLFVGSAWITGFYKKSSLQKGMQSVLVGLIILLGIYALLPEDCRTSRIILLFGALIAAISFFITSKIKSVFYKTSKQKATLIVSKYGNAQAIIKQLENAQTQNEISGIVYPFDGHYDKSKYINSVQNLDELTHTLKIQEIIFNGNDILTKDIISFMMQLDSKLSFKISGDSNLHILGSSSKNEKGEIYDVHIFYNLNQDYYRHIKRIFDFFIGIGGLILAPLIFIINRKLTFLKNMSALIRGAKTVVGYNNMTKANNNLPYLPPSIFVTQKNNRYYARNYTVWEDVEVLIKNIF